MVIYKALKKLTKMIVKTTSAHSTNGWPELDATKNVTNNCHVDNSQWIHKYDNVLKIKWN